MVNKNIDFTELKTIFSCVYLSYLALYFIFCWSLKEGFIVRVVFCFFSHHDEHTATRGRIDPKKLSMKTFDGFNKYGLS